MKGESSKINVSIETHGKSGKIIKNVTVISNDPVTPVIQFNISGFVKKKETANPPSQPPQK
jgi:hypothetical protein